MISTVCKHPDAAMKLLYLMATDETLARYFILGVEGHNYTIDEKGIARYPEELMQQIRHGCPMYHGSSPTSA